MPDDRIDFGAWSLTALTRSLAGPDGLRVTLGSRAADILLALIEAGGGVVGRDELIRRVWEGVTVDEANLAVQISALRKAFGKSGGDIVITAPGRGYRFGGGKTLPGKAATSASATRPPSLAVLPFRVIGTYNDDAYLADGMAEDLIAALSRVRSFFVMARNSSFTLRGREVSAREAGRELGVRYIVTGAIRRAGDRVRVNIELDDAIEERSVWSQRFDRQLVDLFTLQDEIIARVAAAIEPNLHRAEIGRLNRQPTQHASAYDLYLRSTALMHPMTRENCDAALALLDQALAIDPHFARALSAASGCWGWRVTQRFIVPGRREEEEAVRLGELAMLHGSDDPEVQAGTALVFAFLAYRPDVAVDLGRRAVAMHPNSVRTRAPAGWVDLFNDECVSSIVHFEEALRFDPLDPAAGDPLSGISTAHVVLGNYDAAVEWGERAIGVSPERLTSHRAYVAALGMAGSPATAAVARLLELDPGFNMVDYDHLLGRHRRRGPNYVGTRVEGLRRAGVPLRRAGRT